MPRPAGPIGSLALARCSGPTTWSSTLCSFGLGLFGLTFHQVFLPFPLGSAGCLGHPSHLGHRRHRHLAIVYGLRDPLLLPCEVRRQHLRRQLPPERKGDAVRRAWHLHRGLAPLSSKKSKKLRSVFNTLQQHHSKDWYFLRLIATEMATSSSNAGWLCGTCRKMRSPQAWFCDICGQSWEACATQTSNQRG